MRSAVWRIPGMLTALTRYWNEDKLNSSDIALRLKSEFSYWNNLTAAMVRSKAYALKLSAKDPCPRMFRSECFVPISKKRANKNGERVRVREMRKRGSKVTPAPVYKTPSLATIPPPH